MSDEHWSTRPPTPPSDAGSPAATATAATSTPEQPDEAPEDPDKRRKRRVELAGAIIIGIAAILTAFATYQNSQVDGTVQNKSTEAIGLTLDANDAYNDANSFRAEERDWFFGYLTALGNEEEVTAEILERAMPQEMVDLTDEWFAKNEGRLDTDEPLDDPFEDDNDYDGLAELRSTVLLERGNQTYLDASCAVFDSQVAEQRGDDYGLSTVFLAIALVVGGIAALLNGKAAQIIVLVTATVSLVLGVGVLTLAGDEAQARADTAAEFFDEDLDGIALSADESLQYADDLCPE
jgi:hypothetical protein